MGASFLQTFSMGGSLNFGPTMLMVLLNYSWEFHGANRDTAAFFVSTSKGCEGSLIRIIIDFNILTTGLDLMNLYFIQF